MSPQNQSSDRNQLVPPKSMDYGTMFDLSGQSHVVVGAGRGFGETSARLLRHMGAQVLCVDFDTKRGEAVAEELGSPFVRADVTEQAGVDCIVEAANKELGRIDGLIDVIGGARAKAMGEYTVEDWDWDFRTNLRHAFLVGKSIGPLMAAQGSGSMVFISSIMANYASHATPGYPPSKAALQIWIKQLAEEFGPRGVRANGVAPGISGTEKLLTEQYVDADDLLERLSDHTFLRRIGQTYEVASTAVFLMTRGAGYITGHTLPVDGGATSMNPTGFSQAHASNL